mgnify:CR=1 FL=1
MLDPLAVALVFKELGEYSYQIGGFLQKGLVFVCSERGECLKPVVRSAMTIERTFFLFGPQADSMFRVGITDDHKVPWLTVGATGCRDGYLETGVDEGPGHRFGGKSAY